MKFAQKVGSTRWVAVEGCGYQNPCVVSALLPEGIFAGD